MSETLHQLISEQITDLRRQFDERAERLASLGPTEIPTAPLPHCPACAAEAERIDQRVEDPKFDVDEREVRMRWLPCGHQFRAVIELLDAGPVRPGEEPTP